MARHRGAQAAGPVQHAGEFLLPDPPVRHPGEEVGAGRRKVLSNVKPDDAQSEPNMHGDPGEPPKEMKVEQFQIRIPMDPREIKQSQEQAAGTGAPRRKRG